MGDPDAGLPAAHYTISKFKSFLLGTFHSVTGAYLQSCMNEFCFNRISEVEFRRRRLRGMCKRVALFSIHCEIPPLLPTSFTHTT